MIYWFTGQPMHGKTTLAKMLKEFLLKYYNDSDVFTIDGDDIRDMFSNKDYSINGRVNNIGIAQKIAYYLHKNKKQVIVSLVAPYIDQREDFKQLIGKDIVEIYVHAERETERDKFHSEAYIKPKTNFIDINTTTDTEKESFDKLVKQIKYW